MTLGQKVKYRREELKMTQLELARKTKTSQPYISQLENDSFSPSSKMIIMISRVLDLSIDYLLIEERRAV